MMKEGWKYKKLGEVCDTINGLWTGKKPPFINIDVITLKNFTKDCRLRKESFTQIEAEVRHFEKRKLQYGDIIIEKSGGSDTQPVGRPIFFDVEGGNYSFCNFTSALRIKESIAVNPSFLYDALLYLYKSGETFKLQSKTTGIHNLDMKGFLNLRVPVPPLSTQHFIVSELDKINELIRIKKEQLSDFDNLAQSIFYEMFGDPVENEKGWEVKCVGELCTDVKYGTSKPACEGGKYKYLRMNNLTVDGHLDLTNLKYIDIPDEEIEKCIVRKGDILFNRTNSIELVGKTCEFTLDEPMVIAGYIIRVRLNEQMNPTCFSICFNTPTIKKLLQKIAKGAVNQANINSKELQAIKIAVPPVVLQQTFATRIQQIEKLKAQAAAAIKDLETLLASRMQYWFD